MRSYQADINGVPYWYSPEEHRLVSNPQQQHSRTTCTPAEKYESAGSVKAMWLSLTNACNLRCPYCFTSNLTTSKETMSQDTAEACIEFLIREALADAQGNRSRTVIFFGGEPLLQWDLITHTVNYSKLRTSHLPVNIKYMLVTNGTLLKEHHVEFLARNNITVQLSLDGPKELHDKTRKSAGGKGSHERTLRGAKLLQESVQPSNFSVRPTLTENGPSMLTLSRYFVSIGMKNIFLKNVIPKSSDSEQKILNWVELQKHEQYSLAELTVSAYHKGIRINPILANALKLLNGVRNESACAAGNYALSISPEGRVFPCHRYEEDKSMALSDSLDSLEDRSRLPYWKQLNDTLTECRNCWARNFCEKGCPASNHFSGNKSTRFPHSFCETKKFEAEVSIKAAVLLSQRAPHNYLE